MKSRFISPASRRISVKSLELSPFPEWPTWGGKKEAPMADPSSESPSAVFEGALVNLKNSPTHKSVVLQIEIPEEYGEAIVRAFGWPTRVKPLPFAASRLEAASEALKPPPEPPAEPRPFESLSPAEQAGIVCKDPE